MTMGETQNITRSAYAVLSDYKKQRITLPEAVKRARRLVSQSEKLKDLDTSHRVYEILKRQECAGKGEAYRLGEL
jgi:hypothetical protein